jgi:hypothetical protein
MKNILLCSGLLMSQSWIIAQPGSSFGQLAFKEPINWTFADNGSYRTYSTVNNSTNSFCIISIYNSEVSSGNMDQDFRRAWKGIVAGHFTVIKNLKPQHLSSAAGLNYLQDEANISNSKGSFFARLLVFDLKDKTQDVLFLSQNTNMLDQYQSDLDHFTASLQLNNTITANTTADTSTVSTETNNTIISSATTNFDDGWMAALKEDYVLLTKNNSKVYLYYGEKFNDESRDNTTEYFYTHQVLKEYTITNVHARSDMYKYVIEGDAIEKSTGKQCYVVMNVVAKNGLAKNVLEVAPTLNELMQQIGIDFEKMLSYNRFGVSLQNIQGTWRAGAGSSLSYYDYYTGTPTGATAAVTSDKFIFNSNGTYEGEFKGAYGTVGNLKTYQQHEKGSLSVLSPWQISTVDQNNHNKMVVYDCWLEGIKRGMILHLINHQYTGETYDLLKEIKQ